MKQKVIIENPLIKLRDWSLKDVKTLALIGNNEKIAKKMSDGFPFPYTKEKARLFINMSKERDKQLLLAIDYEGKLVGSIGAWFFDDIYKMNCLIAYFVGEKYWNKGIASSSIRMLCEYIFKNFSVNRIYAEPFERNIGSRKALEKAGLKLEATLVLNVIKDNELINSCIYTCFKEAFLGVNQ